MRLALQIETSRDWAAAVLADFDAFLLDHAACERKASATAMGFVAHYPDRRALVEAMLALAAEELEHFRQVYQLLCDRDLVPAADVRDEYVRRLRAAMRRHPDAYLLDRLLVGAIVEARGCERFRLVRDALPVGPLRAFYRGIAASEARHQDLFLRLAEEYHDAARVAARLGELLAAEAQIVAQLPPRAALH